VTGPGVKFVCFDLGGVLVRIVRDWTEACGRAGVSLHHTDQAAWGRHHDLMVRYETGEFNEAGYLDRVPECVPGATRDAVIRIFDAWLLGLYPGANELIVELKARGLVTGCLSNTNDRHWQTMMARPEYAALRGLDHRFASHELRVMKPAAAAYRHVERATGFAGGEILFFDDKPENVEAARSVGWRAERIEHVDGAAGQIRAHLRRHGLL
jgi:HAD superfamily hydrolase (TIGR01509 family)